MTFAMAYIVAVQLLVSGNSIKWQCNRMFIYTIYTFVKVKTIEISPNVNNNDTFGLVQFGFELYLMSVCPMLTISM